mmetsp:Transcript_12535/g.24448  ORF Transcript_12535/g.24448 Transcript_12535/m.24448 type:complete len:526 (+) Transcript_12535:45-1622(+)|eukprot:CAMPEP_0172726174 /NCGR_PEP_ID=MMETSP1074-20121228/90072_1 /TAXON_ID=2916 /ORGANISM="Ceratium fusus, Strain PA161109" /LENGTH=525 /DNA_ID=CAMNT_0013553117 /DNA_START=45 /DNA_END=1622 /DNA_ORIENTATION=-
MAGQQLPMSEDITEAMAKTVGVSPLDQYNVKLIENCHPPTWKDPSKGDTFVYDIIAVGAGAAGLVTAKQSARRGAKSALIENHIAGGDCLFVGCVPSKALLRCARAAYEQRRDDLGVEGAIAPVNFGKIMERMRRLRAQISHVDSHAATIAAGADVYQGTATFTGKDTLTVNGQTLRFKKAVICTGAKAFVPPIPGLQEAPILTNASLFNLTELPPRFVVLGAGPIGLEMAQAFRRFGSEVTVLEGLPRILGPEDPEAAAILHAQLVEEGVTIHAGIKVSRVEHTDKKPFPEIRVHVELSDGSAEVVVCDAFLVATGRKPNVENLGLEVAGVDFKPQGVVVNDDLSTSNPNIFAIGDVIDRPEFKFTHMAGTMAGMAVHTALFKDKQDLPVNAPTALLSEIVCPRATYTEPEVASMGIGNQAQADRKGVEVDIYKAKLEHNDRGILEGHTEGLCHIVCAKGTDKILGATVVAERAGDCIAELTLAAQHGVSMSSVGRTVHSYPTLGEVCQQCALAYNRARWSRME